MKLLVPAFLLLALGYLGTAEVVQSFGKCLDFFFKGIPPNLLSDSKYKTICQKRTEANGYEFATLYDTSRKIPVYSAYKFQNHASCDRTTTWYIEPQLDDEDGGALMATEGSFRSVLKGNNQALNEDYNTKTNTNTNTNIKYERGHLVPVYHRYWQSCADATFTLTNAAPQLPSFNRGQWKAKEATVAKTLTNKCLNRGFRAYIVTGVVPGDENINNRVNIPSYFWSAHCCIDNNDRPKFGHAHYGNNDNMNEVHEISIADLDMKLGFQVFSDQCEPVSPTQTPPFTLAELLRLWPIGSVGKITLEM